LVKINILYKKNPRNLQNENVFNSNMQGVFCEKQNNFKTNKNHCEIPDLKLVIIKLKLRKIK
jgi:hypothetical protein